MKHPGVDAITFDFYHTLAYHREGQGRGARLMAYLGAQGWNANLWEHRVLYDVFEGHDREYSARWSADEREAFRRRFAKRVLDRLAVDVSADVVLGHATPIWEILGPASLAVFPDVVPTLRRLRGSGYRLAVISNWQCGLGHFCDELGIAVFFDHVFASAEVGFAKPDRRIFEHACRALRLGPDRIVHVGDSLTDDFEGGRGAGLQVQVVDRAGETTGRPDIPAISSLAELPDRLVG